MIPDIDSAEGLLREARRRIDARLEAIAARLGAMLPGPGGKAVAYALRTPGKRIRAALVLAAYHSAGGRIDAVEGIATAVEIVHTYSLVHDDLPCMDDDDLRRGRPTTHKVFDVPTAIRAGLLLVPVAAQTLAEAAAELGLRREALGQMAVELFRASGIEGMVGGQWLDLEAEQRHLGLDELAAVHRGKTGALIRASCALGGMAAGAGPVAVAALAAFGADIGLAFQVADDVLDATGTSAQLGKTAGRDAVLQKSTYVRHLGVNGAAREAQALAARAVEHLEQAGVPATSLGKLARYIAIRES